MSAFGHAKITITFEVSLHQPWGDDTTMRVLSRQIHELCRDTLLDFLNKAPRHFRGVIRPVALKVDHFAVSQTDAFPGSDKIKLRSTLR